MRENIRSNQKNINLFLEMQAKCLDGQIYTVHLGGLM